MANFAGTNHSKLYTPIQDVCIVAELHNCPAGYRPLARTADVNDDADLWRDRFFMKRITRYLCVCSTISGTPSKILTDLVVIGDRETVPQGFQPLSHTIDTRDTALKKHLFCVKYAQTGTTNTAIAEIVLFSKSRRPPAGCTFIGEINNIAICTREIACPAYQIPAAKPHGDYSTSANTMNNYFYPQQPPLSNMNSMQNEINHLVHPSSNTGASTAPKNHKLLQRQNTLFIYSVQDVPFHLNPTLAALTANKRNSDRFNLPPVTYKTKNQIETEYDYAFVAERTALQGTK